MRRRDLPPLLFVTALCLTVRLGFLATLERFPPRPAYDGYAQVAEALLSGRGFTPTPLRHFFVRTPGYPLFVAAVWSVAPKPSRFVALAAAQAVLSAATCAILFVVVRATFGKRAALWAGTLFALSPSCTAFSALVYAETMQIFLIATAMWLVLRLSRSPDWPGAVGLGLVWGVAGLTRPEATYLVPCLALPLVFSKATSRRRKFGYGLLVLLANLAVLAPWVARNYRVYGAFVLHVPSSGSAIFSGAYPYPPMYGRAWATVAPGKSFWVWETQEYRSIVEPYWDRDYLKAPHGEVLEAVVRTERSALALDRDLSKAGRKYVKNHAGQFARNLAYHAYDLWSRPAGWFHDWQPRPPLKATWFAAYALGALLTTLGLFQAWRANRLQGEPLGWLAFAALHTALLLPICTEPRYQASTALILFALAGNGAAAVLNAIRAAARAIAVQRGTAEMRMPRLVQKATS